MPAREVDLVRELPLHLFCQLGRLLVEVVVAVDLAVLDGLGQTDVLVTREGRTQGEVLLHLRLLLVFVEDFDPGVELVVVE